MDSWTGSGQVVHGSTVDPGAPDRRSTHGRMRERISEAAALDMGQTAAHGWSFTGGRPKLAAVPGIRWEQDQNEEELKWNLTHESHNAGNGRKGGRDGEVSIFNFGDVDLPRPWMKLDGTSSYACGEGVRTPARGRLVFPWLGRDGRRAHRQH